MWNYFWCCSCLISQYKINYTAMLFSKRQWLIDLYMIYIWFIYKTNHIIYKYPMIFHIYKDQSFFTSFVWNYKTFISFPFYFFSFLLIAYIFAMVQLHYSYALRMTTAILLISIPLATIKIDLFVYNSFLIAFTDS